MVPVRPSPEPGLQHLLGRPAARPRGAGPGAVRPRPGDHVGGMQRAGLCPGGARTHSRRRFECPPECPPRLEAGGDPATRLRTVLRNVRLGSAGQRPRRLRETIAARAPAVCAKLLGPAHRLLLRQGMAQVILLPRDIGDVCPAPGSYSGRERTSLRNRSRSRSICSPVAPSGRRISSITARATSPSPENTAAAPACRRPSISRT